MAKRYENRIQETTQTTGTGNLSVDGPTYRFKEFASELQTGDEFNYLLEDENGAWEIGLGELTTGSPDTIIRKQVFNSSNADALIDLSDGIHRITLVISKESLDDIIDDHATETGGIHGIPEGERALHTGDEIESKITSKVGEHSDQEGGVHGIPSGQNVIHTGNYIAGRASNYPASLNDYSSPTFTPIGVNLSDQVQTNDYRKSVVALVDLDNEDIRRRSWSVGVLTFNRDNGINPPLAVNVNLQKRFDGELMRGWVSGGSYEPDIYPCTFRYNNRTYGGIHFYYSNANHHNVTFFGITNFAGMFGLDYYDADTNTVLEQEVYDTLSSSPWFGGNPQIIDIGERPAIGGDEIMIDGNGDVVKA